jgi:UDP-4-amino-4,6-dideoxy-N-acetyl-beta-L-altrosamine transaminase
MIPYGRQHITQADIDAVVDVLQSDFLTQGPKVPAFEQAVADRVGAKHAVAVTSGTSALHVACLALELGPGDILWTSPITFVASANCALYCGADVDFVDIDPHTYNMSVDALALKLRQAEAAGKLPKVVVPVHFCGQPCDMLAIHALSKEFGFKIIEDACHAIGGKYKNDPIGNCQYSDITIFSFHPVKVITTGEGGMAVTNEPGLAQKMALLRSHGITRDPSQLSKIDPPAYYYQQKALGFNYRMTDIHAALGLSQMNQLDAFVARRRELANRYDALLSDLPMAIPWQHSDGGSAWHLYVIRLNLEKTKKDRRQVFEFMRNNAINVNVHYIPIHTQTYYREMGFKPGVFHEAEKYYREAITLPLFPAMSDQDQDRVVDVLHMGLECKDLSE